MTVPVGGHWQGWFPLTGSSWKPPCCASYLCGALTNLSCHQFSSSSIGDEFNSHSTNQIIVFWLRHCRCRRPCLSSLLFSFLHCRSNDQGDESHAKQLTGNKLIDFQCHPKFKVPQDLQRTSSFFLTFFLIFEESQPAAEG